MTTHFGIGSANSQRFHLRTHVLAFCPNSLKDVFEDFCQDVLEDPDDVPGSEVKRVPKRKEIEGCEFLRVVRF